VSYPKDLDEYTEAELKAELERRQKAREAGLCDYCGRQPSQPACRFPERYSS
jgi:hypothetical protein